MRRPGIQMISQIALVIVLLLGVITGCTRNRPKPTATPTSTQLPPLPTLTPERTPSPVAPQITVAAVEGEEGTQPTPAAGTPAPPATPPTPTTEEETADYTVGPGETLFSIAQRLGTDVDTLRRLNNLTGDIVIEGQVIKVPAAALANMPTPTPVPGQPIEHIVQPGEYLALIANRYGVPPEAIIRANNLRDPNLLVPGQKLIIPTSGATAPSTGSGSAPRKIHIVQRGETLQSIAVRYGVTVQELIAANGIRNPNRIYVGQKLIIP